MACIISARPVWTVEMTSSEEVLCRYVPVVEVRVPQLALDQRQRGALMQQLDSVSMAELVGAFA
jgi:hypothetical protein